MATQTRPPDLTVHPPLRNGDRLDGPEFERRYLGMPDLKKAELIKGVVYMPSPVRFHEHGQPHAWLSGWAFTYAANTPGVECGSDSTVRLGRDNRPQPDVLLRIRPESGGRSTDEDGYLRDAPELVAEISASTVRLVLHDKFDVYEQTGVREYVVWRVEDGAVDYFVRRAGRLVSHQPAADGVFRSEVFPGLWLDAAALIRRDPGDLLRTLQDGLTSADHAGFVARLGQTSG